PEPAEMALRDRAFEALEDSLLILGSDPDAVIAQGEQGTAVDRSQCNFDRLALAVFDRVRKKVGQNLVEPHSIPQSDAGAVRHQPELATGFRELLAKAPGHVIDHLREIDRLDLQDESSDHDPRNVEQVVDELSQTLHLLVNRVELRIEFLEHR